MSLVLKQCLHLFAGKKTGSQLLQVPPGNSGLHTTDVSASARTLAPPNGDMPQLSRNTVFPAEHFPTNTNRIAQPRSYVAANDDLRIFQSVNTDII